MPETIYVPIAGETVRGEGAATDGGGDWINGRWTPGSRTRRSSLHDIRIKPSSAPEETAPQPVETPQYAQSYAPAYAQQTYDTQQAGYTQQEGNMGALSTHEQMPDLDDEYFDPYDREQLNALIERRVQAALAPARQAQNFAEATAQHNAALEKYGDDPNFKSTMDEALHACLRDAQAGRAVDIVKAYEAASESVSRRPNQRLAHLPPKARTIRGLGELIEHNHKTGRAKPYGRGR